MVADRIKRELQFDGLFYIVHNRRMFPVIKTQVNGLSPGDMYTVFLEFVQVVGQRWKYINSEWSPTTTSDPATKNPFYKHPESPNFGKHWMEQPISFAKIKLTNRPDNPGQVHIRILYIYIYKNERSNLNNINRLRI